MKVPLSWLKEFVAIDAERRGVMPPPHRRRGRGRIDRTHRAALLRSDRREGRERRQTSQRRSALGMRSRRGRRRQVQSRVRRSQCEARDEGRARDGRRATRARRARQPRDAPAARARPRFAACSPRACSAPKASWDSRTVTPGSWRWRAMLRSARPSPHTWACRTPCSISRSPPIAAIVSPCSDCRARSRRCSERGSKSRSSEAWASGASHRHGARCNAGFN